MRQTFSIMERIPFLFSTHSPCWKHRPDARRLPKPHAMMDRCGDNDATRSQERYNTAVKGFVRFSNRCESIGSMLSNSAREVASSSCSEASLDTERVANES